MISDYYNKRITAFLQESIDIHGSLLRNGLLISETTINLAMQILTDEARYEKEDLRKEALAEYGIIIPHYYFQEEGAENETD